MSDYLQKIIYLSQDDYNSLFSGTSINRNGITLDSIDDNNIYITDGKVKLVDLDDFILPVSKGGTGLSNLSSGYTLSGTGTDAMAPLRYTNNNDLNTLVYRNNDGDFSAGTITAALSGNATTSSYPLGFGSRTTSSTWGNTTGTCITSWNDGSGCEISFFKNNPSSGKLSVKIDGRYYMAEGAIPVAGLKSANSYWGMTDPDGADNVWIRTTTQGIIPYQSGGATAGHGQLGTDSWYFSKAYIQNIYGTLNGNAATAAAIQTAGTTAQFYRGDNSWSNIIKQTANATLSIDTNLKIGTARKDLNFDIATGSGTGINDGYAGGITWGTGGAAHAGIYYQTSGSYGTRLIFGTTTSYANGAYARMIIQNDGKVGIGTLSPDTLLTVNGNAKATKFIGDLEGNADTATSTTYIQGIDHSGSNIDIATTIINPENGKIKYNYCIGLNSTGLFAHNTTSNTNAIITLSTGSTTNYFHQLGLSTNKHLYHRAFINEEPSNDKDWNEILDSSNYTDYAAAAGHTHNYAGSSSAGGAATTVTTANSNAALYLVGVASDATTSLKYNSDIVMDDGTLSLTNIQMSGDTSAITRKIPAWTGGWARQLINVAANDGTTLMSASIFGNAQALSYIYIGTAAHNSTDNIRFYTGGKIMAKEFQGNLTGNAATASKLNTNELTNQDLNDYKDDSTTWYFADGDNSIANKPTGVTSFGLYVYRNASAYRVQELYSSSGTKWIRYWDNGAWKEWEQMYGTLHKPTAVDVGAATSDHNHDSTYAPISTISCTAANVKTALGIKSSGSATKWLNEKGSWVTPTASDIDAAPAVTGGYLPLSGGTMTGQITLHSTGYKTSNTSGYSVDQYGNFKHQTTTAANVFEIQKNNGTATFKVTYESGEVAAAKYVVDAKVRLEYNSTDNSLDFVFI